MIFQDPLSSLNPVYETPLHPYSKALLSAVPHPNLLLKKERIILKGEIPSPLSPHPGCVFHTRYPSVMEICKVKIPE